MNNNKILLTKINKKRQEMIEIGLSQGLTSKETVRCSQELDALLNKYNGEKKDPVLAELAV
ncbi:aspartyl-phosphate phosphatase Spo0E family protein [Aquibacillus kalidii]|uniref:aspartyl-phosphate phosphatase Spo0E family protein n=1 Tax=Aquibacillus kalidii TaxID=2762597 RepID=UPI002E29CCF0|nr:aspartyl-phosphate phosphatase Spo0E family protein [Aquibacillus kalidii]